MAEPQSKCQNYVFLHARFEVPNSSSGGDDKSAIVTHQFSGKDSNPALIGLEGDPIKPTPGDYTYSGMHDHGPLPKPKEGGVFASLIGLCKEAKSASDKYLTEVIEKEKR